MGINVNRRVICIIQARMGSSRLPEKVLMDISKKPMLLHIIKRLKQCLTLDDIVVATTLEEQDDIICETLARENIKYYRGSENDVLERYLETAQQFKADIIVRVTADCPLIHPPLIDSIVSEFKAKNYDYISPKSELGLIRGLDTEVFSLQALEKANRLAQDKSYREHVTLYMYRYPEEFAIGTFPIPEQLKSFQIRLCVDEIGDFKLIQAIYNKLYKNNEIVDIYQALEMLTGNPKLLQLNINVQQKEV